MLVIHTCSLLLSFVALDILIIRCHAAQRKENRTWPFLALLYFFGVFGIGFYLIRLLKHASSQTIGLPYAPPPGQVTPHVDLVDYAYLLFGHTVLPRWALQAFHWRVGEVVDAEGQV